MPFGSTAVPTITSPASYSAATVNIKDATISIENATDLTGAATITVTAQYTIIQKVFTIKFMW